MAHEIIKRVRTRLLIDQPFFGQLATELKLVEDKSIPTACVNNIELRYNPKFFETLTNDERLTVVAHEVMHPALGHIWRRQSRHPLKWNMAADYAINPILVQAGFTPLKNWLYDAKFKGMSAEEIYAKLEDIEELTISIGAPGDGQSPQGGGNVMGNCPTGSFTDPVEGGGDAKDGDKAQASGQSVGSSVPKTEDDWQVIVEQAARVAATAGNLPGGLEWAIKKTHEPTVDWRQELHEFVVHNVTSEPSWTNPNRRYIARDIYLPGATRENVGPIVIGVDVSGSTMGMRHLFGSEITGLIQEARPEKVIVAYWDTRVTNVQEFEPDDNIELDAGRSNGGTIIAPFLQWVEDNVQDAVCMIILTDLELGDVPKELSIPTLWAVPEYINNEGPYGRTIQIKDLAQEEAA